MSDSPVEYQLTYETVARGRDAFYKHAGVWPTRITVNPATRRAANAAQRAELRYDASVDDVTVPARNSLGLEWVEDERMPLDKIFLS